VLIYDYDTWWEYPRVYASLDTWTRVSYLTLGEADTSGNFQNWLATPVQARMPFNITTDDRRITGAGGPTTNGTDFWYLATNAFNAARGSYFFSWYRHMRYEHLFPSYAGPAPAMLKAEMDLLRAEAALYANDRATAVPLINTTRVGRGQLAPVTADMSVDQLRAAMQYGKRIELMKVSFGNHYLDPRGWGRLVTGTPIHMPIPALELETLGREVYTFGGALGGAATCAHPHCMVP
jgi:hypothetical protein